MVLFLLALAVPAQAQRPRDDGDGPGAGPNLDGTWYNRSNGGECQIIQRGSDRATLINEKGDRARGTIEGDRVSTPDWRDEDNRPLVGRVRGNRIVWPDGNYWYR